MIDVLKSASASVLRATELMPRDHLVWTEGGWKSFLDSPDAVHAAINYVDRNPVKAGCRHQSWPFVVEYDGWPFRAGRAK